ncbi:MAG: cysteine desulfurase [Planctomycetes bacterium]|nr:cysteine desulfurase [Planctomycetota bacterium]
MPDLPIYLDNHATTRVDPRVLDAMLPYFCEQYGNAASTSHRYGEVARKAVEAARAQVAALVGADADDVVFTSGATEANNLAIKGLFASLLRTEQAARPHLIVNSAEHRAVLDPAKRIRRNGADVTTIAVDECGQVAPDAVEDALRPATALVSTMLVNNEVGTINPVSDIAELCRKNGSLVHCDAVQAAGRIPINFSSLGADLLTLSAHKIYGPKGIGALIRRRDGARIPLEPLIDGGGHESSLRSGTLPVPLIVGFGEACRISLEEGEAETTGIAALRDELWTRLSSGLDGLHLNGHPTERVAGNLNVCFDGIDGDVLLNAMTEIAVSSGSACTSANPQPSHVLIAMGRSDELTRASLRFGLGRFNTQEEIAFAAEFVVSAVMRIRKA